MTILAFAHFGSQAPDAFFDSAIIRPSRTGYTGRPLPADVGGMGNMFYYVE